MRLLVNGEEPNNGETVSYRRCQSAFTLQDHNLGCLHTQDEGIPPNTRLVVRSGRDRIAVRESDGVQPGTFRVRVQMPLKISVFPEDMQVQAHTGFVVRNDRLAISGLATRLAVTVLDAANEEIPEVVQRSQHQLALPAEAGHGNGFVVKQGENNYWLHIRMLDEDNPVPEDTGFEVLPQLKIRIIGGGGTTFVVQPAEKQLEIRVLLPNEDAPAGLVVKHNPNGKRLWFNMDGQMAANDTIVLHSNNRLAIGQADPPPGNYLVVNRGENRLVIVSDAIPRPPGMFAIQFREYWLGILALADNIQGERCIIPKTRAERLAVRVLPENNNIPDGYVLVENREEKFYVFKRQNQHVQIMEPEDNLLFGPEGNPLLPLLESENYHVKIKVFGECKQVASFVVRSGPV